MDNKFVDTMLFLEEIQVRSLPCIAFSIFAFVYLLT